jgi:small subunit ribosomal protein S1
MSNLSHQAWSDDKLIDDAAFQEEDAVNFLELLGIPSENGDSAGQPLKVGSILKGKIVEITKDHVVIDVGLKSEGLVEINEFSDTDDIFLDNEVEVFLEYAEDEAGQIVLSRERAERQRKWENILDTCEEGSIVTGEIIRKVKGGLMVDIGMEAFLPGSQIENRRIRNLDDYLGHTYDFKILKINVERKNVVVSRRELIEAERMVKKAELLESIQIGELRTGTVKNITDFGVFLDLDGIDGLLHITDMTWKRIRHPSEMAEIGQELEVMILNVDQEKGRVALGLKQKDANPWEEIEARYPVGTRINGRVVNLVPYGAFIEIEAGIEGLVHISEMTWDRSVNNPSELVTIGDEVEAIVQEIQKEEGKISLSIKACERNPWDEVEERYPVHSIVEGAVKSLTNYGAFVELEEGVQGLVHISDMNWTKKFSHPSEILNKEDVIKAKVLHVDTESQKITLGIKQLTDNPWEDIDKRIPVGSEITGTIHKVTAFGAFIELDNGLEGLIHVTELSDQPFGKVEDIVSPGQSVTAKVVKLDPEHKKIALSLKEYVIEKKNSNEDDIVVGSTETEAAVEVPVETEAAVEVPAESEVPAEAEAAVEVPAETEENKS